MGTLGKVIYVLEAKFSFTVGNKMGNSHRKGWSHFKINIDDWDISFPKVLRIMNELGKIFRTGENGINPLGILPVLQNIWPKSPWRY